MNIKVSLLEHKIALASIKSYYKKHNYIIDSYYEDHILEAEHYSITNTGLKVGIISIFKTETIVHFSILDKYMELHNELFNYAVSLIKPKDVYVSTENALLLCNALDHYSNIIIQDCVYQIVINRNKRISEINTIKATVSDKDIIQKFDNGFFKNLDDNLEKEQIYIGKYNNEIICFGIIEQNKILSQYASIGMFVRKEHRGKSYGSEMLKCLMNECSLNGLVPIAGCFMDNKYSRNALNRAGMFNRIKLLKIKI